MKFPHYFLLCIPPIWLITGKGILTIIVLVNAIFALVAIAGRIAEKQKILDKTTKIFALILAAAILLFFILWLYETKFLHC